MYNFSQLQNKQKNPLFLYVAEKKIQYLVYKRKKNYMTKHII